MDLQIDQDIGKRSAKAPKGKPEAPSPHDRGQLAVPSLQKAEGSAKVADGFSFFVPGDPVPWARPVATKSGVVNRQKQKEHRRVFQLYLRKALGNHFPTYALGTPIAVKIRFVYPFTTRQKKPGLKSTRPDLDNLCKQVLDCLQGESLVFEDDGAVAELTCQKAYGLEPGTYVEVRALDA